AGADRGAFWDGELCFMNPKLVFASRHHCFFTYARNHSAKCEAGLNSRDLVDTLNSLECGGHRITVLSSSVKISPFVEMCRPVVSFNGNLSVSSGLKPGITFVTSGKIERSFQTSFPRSSESDLSFT